MRKIRGKGAGGGGRGKDEGENGKLEKLGKKRVWMRKGKYEEIEKQTHKYMLKLRLGGPKREQKMRRENNNSNKQTNKQKTQQEQLQEKGT